MERSLINPLSRLLTSGQVRSGDLLRVDYDASQRSFTFARQSEKLSVRDVELFAQKCVVCAAGLRWSGGCWASGNAIQCPNRAG